jgi:alpha-glucosidase
MGNEEFIWWKHGVMYEIWPRSYHDSNGDGSGDLKGITDKLDYLANLGIDGIWLTPFNTSPMLDEGYDVAHYREIDPVYGTMADFDRLLQEAHKRNIHIIIDLVVNHTSDQHPWFKESRSSRDNPRRDWFIWREGKSGKPPTNWKALVGGSTWEWDKTTGQYYLHSFLKCQPDLNWRNPEVRREIYDTMRFWLDKGVDGFRCDILNYFLKDDQLRDNPVNIFKGPVEGFQEHLYSRNQSGMDDILKEMRGVLDEYQGRMMVGEVFVHQEGPETAVKYMGKGDDRCHLSFEFSLLFTRWSAKLFSERIKRWYAAIPEKGWPCNVLSNHDQPRAVTRFASSKDTIKRAKVLAALLLTLRGTPFMYYGEEIGMPNCPIRRSEIRDTIGKMYWPLPFGRDGERCPMQWNGSLHAGFSTARPWLPVSDSYHEVNVDAQFSEHLSLLNFYRKLIALRRNKTALSMGGYEQLPQQGDIMAYRRSWQNGSIYVILNFGNKQQRYTNAGDQRWKILMGTRRETDTAIDKGSFDVSPYEVIIAETAL